MTLRVVTPAGGQQQVSLSYLAGAGQMCGPEVDVLLAGQVLDVVPGSPLESAIGLGNLTAVTGKLLTNAINASGGQGSGSGTAN